jgi:hypothetical protein
MFQIEIEIENDWGIQVFAVDSEDKLYSDSLGDGEEWETLRWAPLIVEMCRVIGWQLAPPWATQN